MGDGQNNLSGLFRWEGLQCLGMDSAAVEQQSLSQVLLEDIRTIRTVVGKKPKKSSLFWEQPRNNYKQSVMISKECTLPLLVLEAKPVLGKTGKSTRGSIQL